MRRLGDPWFSRMGLNGPVPWGNGSGGCYTKDIWNPSYVPGLLWWYDFSQVDTLFQDPARTIPVTADGDPIGGVTDLSGNGRHLSQVTGAQRPTHKTNIVNGLSVCRSDAVDDNLRWAASVAENNAIYLVIKTGTYLSAWIYYLFDSGATSDGVRFFRNSLIRYFDGGATGDFTPTAASTLYQLGWLRDNGNVTKYQNADAPESVAIAGDGVSLNFLLGYGNDDTCEIFSYSTPPSGADHTLIWNYMNTKWAVY